MSHRNSMSKAGQDRRFTHGMSRHPLFNTWASMMHRCYAESDPRYSDYGGRGIRVCERWHDIHNFVADMHPRPDGKTLDRVDPDGDYEPGNVRWATPGEQQNNRRTSVRYERGGESLTATEWANRVDLDPALVRCRLNRGWSIEDALRKSRAKGDRRDAVVYQPRNRDAFGRFIAHQEVQG